MTISFDTYRDKVMGCWAGKNIGGVLGAPYECKRQYNDVDFYTVDLSSGPPPNDDLDLQIIWLAAVERYGRNVSAAILGEYWLSYVIPNWVEYGTGKANLSAGLPPPISGVVDNVYKDSCGCFIRSEVWACLAPGHPEIAARYAYEDAIVDHEGEGMFGEIFFAALQSAAFVESDAQKLIDIGLSYIPANSAMVQAINCARECYKSGVLFKEARIRIHNTAPGTFGVMNNKVNEIPESEMDVGKAGFDAPENVAFTIAGLLYGEGDFGKAVCLANACGEDTDCTAATLGATLGIIMGASGLPEKWTAPLDDKIATLCIDKTSKGIFVPDTVTELTDRLMRSTPNFLGLEHCDVLNKSGYTIETAENLFCRASDEYLPFINGQGKSKALPVCELCALSPYVVRYEFPAFSIRVDYGDSAFFTQGEPRKIKVSVVNTDTMRKQQWVKITPYMPTGVVMLGARNAMVPLNNLYHSEAVAVFEFNTDEYESSKLEFIIDVSLEGRHSSGAVKVIMMRKTSV